MLQKQYIFNLGKTYQLLLKIQYCYKENAKNSDKLAQHQLRCKINLCWFYKKFWSSSSFIWVNLLKSFTCSYWQGPDASKEMNPQYGPGSAGWQYLMGPAEQALIKGVWGFGWKQISRLIFPGINNPYCCRVQICWTLVAIPNVPLQYWYIAIFSWRKQWVWY